MTPKIRAAVLTEARTWLGTPYRHQASAKRIGCDCLGLVRGVYRAVCGPEPQAIPAYQADWAERGTCDTLLNAAQSHLIEVPACMTLIGDVLVFRYRPDQLAKHCAILSASKKIIHAWQGQAVCETTLTAFWQHRIVGQFAFPQIRS